jgi:hypothetical protein
LESGKAANAFFMSTDDASTTTANDIGGANDMLSPMEGTDADDLRVSDDVVDPPEGWSGVTKFGMTAQEQAEGESLDQRLAEEVPDVAPDDIDPLDGDDDVAGDESVGSDLAPEDPGVHLGQVDGAPEDGDPLFQVVE